MAGRRRAAPAKRKAGDNSLAQFGLMDMPDISSLGNIDEGDDSDDGDNDDLEAELMALMSGKVPQKANKKPKPKVATLEEISKMADECTKDDFSDDDADLSGDEELVAELNEIVPGVPSGKQNDVAPVPPPRSTSQNSIVEMLEERLTLYHSAESAAKSLGDSTKVRRYGRAIKTLEGLVKTAKAGGTVAEEDIPPAVSIPKTRPAERPPAESPSTPPEKKQADNEAVREPPPPIRTARPAPSPPVLRPAPAVPRPAPVVPNTAEAKSDDPQHVMLCGRRDQYKVAALKAKRSGDSQTAIKYVRIAKQFDAVIAALEKGQPVDLTKMPPPPPDAQDNASVVQTSPTPAEKPVSEEQFQNAGFVIPDSNEPEDPSLFGAPPPPATVLEALQQRLEKFQSTLENAKSEGNNSKARRIGRIVKQYEDAIKMHKAGKPVEFEELPAPPGFGPIPISDQKGSSPADTAKPSMPPSMPKPEPQKVPPRPAPVPSNHPKEVSLPGDKPERNPKLSTRSNSVLDSQLHYLLERQRLFKQAALESKNKGDIQQAKEYLRKSKGLEPMIQATRAGLPIDATTIPSPPQIQDDYVVIEKSDCISVGDEGSEDLCGKLERDLVSQIEICQRNKNHFLKLGDVSSASKFEKLAANSRKDLDVIKHLWKLGKPMPQFHYETRLFSMVQCNTDLGDNVIEIAIERGINLPGKPTELDSYVKIEFPFPNDEPQRAKTHTVKDTNNPEYKETFNFEINRKSRSLCRNLKRPGLKLEVWQKGWFLKGDTLLGTANIKLQDLETKCTVHDSFDLMEGRKNTGGKIEVKVRLRDPLLAKQVEEVRERWLVVGS